MRTDAYLERIAVDDPVEVSADCLRVLHRAHMLSVPFENLDITLGTRIECRLPVFYEKIVQRRRGGFCYELNGLFAWLLGELGFRVDMYSARVFSDGREGPEFDHMCLRVAFDDCDWLADVGFGDSFVEPLPLEGRESVVQHGVEYRLTQIGPERVLEQRRDGADWAPQYVFSRTGRRLEEFEPMCDFQQSSPESPFTRKSVCSRATPDGRVTLANGKLIVTRDGVREERAVQGEAEYRALLARHFAIELAADAKVGRLVARQG